MRRVLRQAEPEQEERDASPGTRRRFREREEPVVEVKHDVINERVILAAALVDHAERAKLARRFPTPDAFGGKIHGRAWVVVLEAERRGLAYDPATFKAIDPNLDTDYLDDLVNERPAVPPNLHWHVEALEWDAQRVSLAKGPLSTLVELVRDRQSEPEKVRAVMKQIGALASDGDAADVRRFIRDPRAVVDGAMRALEERRRGKARFPYGLAGLDDFEDGTPRTMPGAAPKHITVTTGISGGGKSTFVKNFVVAQARLDRRVTFGAWEEGDEPSIEELATISLGMSRAEVRAGNVSDDAVVDLRREEERIGDLVTFVDNPFRRSSREKRRGASNNDRNLDRIYDLTVETRPDIFVCDLWELTIPETKPDQITAALYRQLDIAKDTRTHFMLVHQQRLKEVEVRADKRPTREGLKGSSAWVEVATTIFGVHYPSKFKQIQDNKIEVIFLKQRFGAWPLLVEFDYDPKLGSLWGGKSVEYRHAGEGDELGFGDEVRRSARRGRARS